MTENEQLEQFRAIMGVQGFKAERADSAGDDIMARTRIDKDPFADLYPTFDNILRPTISPQMYYKVYGESDMLHACIEAMRKNVHGFGYELQFLGDDLSEKDSPEANAQHNKATSFFDYTNEDDNMTGIRDKTGEDYEVTGNGAIEVIRRPRTNEVAMAYYMPITDCRMCILDEEPTKVKITVPRDGKDVSFYIKKFFRRFVQVRASGDVPLRWFKSFGDKRFLDANTGEYKKSASACSEVATELLWISNSVGGRPYGYPRWIGAIQDILGRAQAQFVNYDLFEHQGIPPLMIVVENGSLTDESREDIQNLVESMRGARNFNKVGLLEAVPEISGLDEQANVKIRIQNMIENRNQDLLFNSYLKYSGDNIRQAFRLPALYLGSVAAYSYSSAFTGKTICEEQVFIPERTIWDEMINRRFMREALGCTMWRYVSKGPQMAGAPDIINAVTAFGNTGALSINNAIDILNNVLGMQISKYDEEFAEYPFAIVQEMLKQARIEIPELATSPEPPIQVMPMQNKPPQLPEKTTNTEE